MSSPDKHHPNILSPQNEEREPPSSIEECLFDPTTIKNRLVSLIDQRPNAKQRIWKKIKNDRACKDLLNFFISGREQEGDTLTIEALIQFLENVPTPMDFEEKCVAIPPVSDAKALERLRTFLYGKQETCWQEWILLRKAAHELAFMEKSVAELKELVQEPPIRTIDPSEYEAILSHVEIHADPFQGKMLTVDRLREEGLEPHHEIIFGSGRYYLSAPYAVGKRMVFTLFVEAPSNVHNKRECVARSHYLSRSQTTWRYLVDLVLGSDGKIKRYGKGLEEQSLQLPFVIQKALFTLLEREPLCTPKDPLFAFAGTARAYQEDNRHALMEDRSYYVGAMRKVFLLPGNFVKSGKNGIGDKIPPENLRFKSLSEPTRPDFRDEPLLFWHVSQTPLYGPLTYEIFGSHDGQLLYLICRDSQDRAFLGGIEIAREPISSNGMKRRWVFGGDLLTPIYEYREMAGEYAGPPCAADDRYVNIFDTYVHKIPMIQEYLDCLKNRKK